MSAAPIPPAVVGGIPGRLSALAHALACRGWTVQVVPPHPDPPRPAGVVVSSRCCRPAEYLLCEDGAHEYAVSARTGAELHPVGRVFNADEAHQVLRGHAAGLGRTRPWARASTGGTSDGWDASRVHRTGVPVTLYPSGR